MKIGRIDKESRKQIDKWIPKEIKNEELVSDAPKNMRTFNSNIDDSLEDVPVTKNPANKQVKKEESMDDDFWKNFSDKK